jgi:hypothetical protein
MAESFLCSLDFRLIIRYRLPREVFFCWNCGVTHLIWLEFWRHLFEINWSIFSRNKIFVENFENPLARSSISFSILIWNNLHYNLNYNQFYSIFIVFTFWFRFRAVFHFSRVWNLAEDFWKMTVGILETRFEPWQRLVSFLLYYYRILNEAPLSIIRIFR